MKVMVNSIPKGGTHLLLKLVYLLGIVDDPKRFWLGAGIVRRGYEPLNRFRKGGYSNDRVTIGLEVPVEVGATWLGNRLRKIPDNHCFGAHCLYSGRLSDLISANSVKPVCIIRDPRAIAASHMHYIKSWKKHFFHKHYMRLPSDKERMRLAISGGKLGRYQLLSLRERYQKILGWQHDPLCTFVRFEDLVGIRGGGTDKAQVEAIATVAHHLGIRVSGERMKVIQEELYGTQKELTKSATFRKGKIDAWRDELDGDLVDMLEIEMKDVLTDIGY